MVIFLKKWYLKWRKEINGSFERSGGDVHDAHDKGNQHVANDLINYLTQFGWWIMDLDGISECFFVSDVITGLIVADVGYRLHVDNGGECRCLFCNSLLLWRTANESQRPSMQMSARGRPTRPRRMRRHVHLHWGDLQPLHLHKLWLICSNL